LWGEGASEETERAAHLGKEKWWDVGSMLEEDVTGDVEIVVEVIEGLFHPRVHLGVVPPFGKGFDLFEFGRDEVVVPISIGDRVDLLVIYVVDYKVLVPDAKPVTIVTVHGEEIPEAGMRVILLSDEGGCQEGMNSVLVEGCDDGPNVEPTWGPPILDIGPVGVDVVAVSFDGFHV
jgi:hypothetical protein